MEIKIEGETLEQVTEFVLVYLGRVITEDGRCTKDIRVKRRIDLASAMFGTMKKI